MCLRSLQTDVAPLDDAIVAVAIGDASIFVFVEIFVDNFFTAAAVTEVAV